MRWLILMLPLALAACKQAPNAHPAVTAAEAARIAEAAEPARNTDRVVRLPHTSISQAAAAYPGSWARVMIRVNPNDFTRS